MVDRLLPLTLEKVAVRRRSKNLLGPVDLTLAADGITVLAGPNGAGKTTLLRVMHGLQRPSEGRLSWSASDPDAQRRQSFVFQQPILLRRTVLANVAYAAKVRGVSHRAAQERAMDWLKRVGLEGFGNRPADRLSGGETQKLALARALVTEPTVLFLDEPTSSLDAASTRDIELIIESASKCGTKIILATHDLGQLRRLASDVVFLNKGLVLEHRPAHEFLTSPAHKESAAYVRGDLVL